MVGSAAYYQRVLESIYTTIEALDASSYSWGPSDGWTQARHSLAPVAHLQTFVTLGDLIEWGRSQVRYECQVEVALRYTPDDDSRSQSNIHAAARALMDLLQEWHMTSGERALPQTYSVGMAHDEWAVVTVTFHLLAPRH